MEKYHCKGCDEMVDKLSIDYFKGSQLCENCEAEFEDKTGNCSLNCCLGFGCDESC